MPSSPREAAAISWRLGLGRVDYDVIVVGGSAAGLHLAAQVARGGARVLVLERSQSFGTPTRTLIVTPQLENFLSPLPQRCVDYRVDAMELHSPHAHRKVDLGQWDYVVDREQVNTALAERAEGAGAEVLKGATVVSIDFASEGAVVRAEIAGSNCSKLKAGTLVGADGAHSTVAQSLRAAPLRMVPVLQAVVASPGGNFGAAARVWFDPVLTNYFLWLVPLSETSAVVGLVGGAGNPVRPVLDEFMHRRGLRPLGYQGAVIPLYASRRKLEFSWPGGKALLVGDAAGHVKVTTVGGLVSGLWGAEAASASILGQVPYRQALRKLNRELYLHETLRFVLDRFEAKDYDRLLAGLSSATHRWLGKHSRDETLSAIADLLLGQPGLALHAVRPLLRRYGKRERLFGRSEREKKEPWAVRE